MYIGSFAFVLVSALLPIQTLEPVPNANLTVSEGPVFADVSSVASSYLIRDFASLGSLVTRRVGQYVSVTGGFLEPPEYPLREVSWEIRWDPDCLRYVDMVGEDDANGSVVFQMGNDGRSMTLTWNAPEKTAPKGYAPHYRVVFKCIGVPATETTSIEATLLKAVDVQGESVESLSVESPDKIAISQGTIRWRVRIEGYVDIEVTPIRETAATEAEEPRNGFE